MWAEVQRRGGAKKVTEARQWASVARSINIPEHWSNASFIIKQAYETSGMFALEQVSLNLCKCLACTQPLFGHHL